MASRLITPVLEEILKSYPLYSQDGKGKDAVAYHKLFVGIKTMCHIRLVLRNTANVMNKIEPEDKHLNK